MVNGEAAATEPFCALAPAQRRRMLELGPRWNDDIVGHRKAVIDCYTPILAAAPKAARVERDLAYGPHPRHVLDVFEPAGARADAMAGALRDAVLFVHGGAFVRGSKSVNGEIYDNVCHWFARQGCVAVNVEYRLADDAPWPGGAQDVARALAWVGEHAGRWGIDPARIFLIGHSAGGAHAASCLFDPALAGAASQEDVAGLVLSIVAHFNSGEEWLGREILAFMATVPRGAPANRPRA
ncbi:MAG: alpha/beta hydrolase [Paraburkholderia sp.]|jgi:acetyl esterase/lipase|nr:alpha/beta hydrolase [Paraburkholderia sp.]